MKAYNNRTASSARTSLSILLALIPSITLAINTGTDLDLSMKPIAGGMAGAAFAKPQEVSAALFGNPATLTQFKGFNVTFGAGIVEPVVDNVQRSSGFTNRSHSLAENYVTPDFAVSGEALPGLVIAGGLEVDSGLGANYRTHPLNAGAGLGLGGKGVAGAATIPLIVELLSFSANVGAAYELTPDLSLGAALTVGVGFAQLGTVGSTSGLSGLTGDFDGTSASVHRISLRGSAGLTYRPTPETVLSLSAKSPLEYNYHDIMMSTTASGDSSFQSVALAQPLEVSFGVGQHLTDNFLVEADLLWKNWSGASLYQDIYDDQFLGIVGGQYSLGNWSVRAGYSYATDILRDEPNGTIGGFSSLGTLPLNTTVPGVLNNNDLVKVVQTSLGPVIWQHTVTAGLGYKFSPKFRLDAFAAYAFEGSAERNTLALGQYQVNASEWALGAGANFSF